MCHADAVGLGVRMRIERDGMPRGVRGVHAATTQNEDEESGRTGEGAHGADDTDGAGAFSAARLAPTLGRARARRTEPVRALGC
jgi:hypothetical protein